MEDSGEIGGRRHGRQTDTDNDLGQVLGIRKGRKGLVEKEPGLPVYVERYSCIQSQEKNDGQKVTRQTVKGWETWIVKADDCEK